MSAKSWTLKVTIEINDALVGDGLNISEMLPQVEALFTTLVPYKDVQKVTVKAKIMAAPTPEEIALLQQNNK